MIVEGTLDIVGAPEQVAAVRGIPRKLVAETAVGGERAMAAGREIDCDDIRLVRHALLRCEVGGDGQFASVGTDVVVLVRWRPRLQRQPGPGEQIMRTTRSDIGRKHVRFTSVGKPVIPIAVFRALGNMRLHF